ncbi:MAG: hypothetical protein LBG65_07265 [Puniceicoccales bacterium]|nr:hypothetical protein [Puniceicoccales bacterium]
MAHRGFWKTAGSAQNSLSSLRNAQELGVYGSEFDVWLTKDDVLVVNHDAKIGKTIIEEATFAEMAAVLLSNGEKLPTLESYLKIGAKNKKTRLVFELKPHKSKERERRAAALSVALVEKHKLSGQVEYISFSLHACKEFRRLVPSAQVYYLGGDLPPAEIKRHGLTGIDYKMGVLRKNPKWIDEARELGLKINVWTVNKPADMRYFIGCGVDFITTDEPGKLCAMIDAKK